MDQDTKGRTSVGTGAPGAPPPRGASAEQPTIAAPSALPVMMPASTGPIAPIVTPASALPTVAIGPPQGLAVGTRSDASNATLDGGDPDVFIGQELCGYEIRRKLAEGGMGVVYEGVHGKIGRRGAIKVLKLEFCRSDDVVERFHQEARAVNAIRHENIVDIYNFGRDAYGRVFFVMEYLEGEPLSGRIRRGMLTWTEAFPILEQTLRALKAAHDKGFVHRDLKPDNIWLKYVDGRVQVKLLDFGIAKLIGSDGVREKLTRTGSVIGTPHYMSPEQINGSKDVDHRTDLYAMGVIIYEMFAGITPFVGDTMQAIMTGHLFTEPPRLPELPADLGVPAPIAEIVDRMLVKDPAGRYDSVSDVLADLHDVHRNRPPAKAETLRRERPTRAPVPQLVPAAPPRARPTRTPRLVGGVALAAIAVASVVIWTSRAPVVVPPPGPREITREPPPPPPPPPPSPLPSDAVLREQAEAAIGASLADLTPRVRKDVAGVIGALRDRSLVDKLTELAASDPDDEVRGRIAHALGMLGASAAAPMLAKLETAAPAPLKVWYASALARLGDKRAVKRLLGYARSKDLGVSLAACLQLGEIALPGDSKAVGALRALARREAELEAQEPYSVVAVLMKAAALRDAAARKALYAVLEDNREDAQIAAAVALARLGDDAGREVLRSEFARPDSPRQLTAAVALTALGEYAGLQLMIAKLGDKDPEVRRLAARGLGEMGERTGMVQLVASEKDGDGVVRTAAAAAIIAIVGFDPQVLAQASINWTKGALESQDWVMRKAAAGVLADLPAKEAVPLLARAFADPSADVRLTASRSAGKIKTRAAAEQVVAVVETETDPKVKEQQVKALGEIGDAVAHDTLARISDQPGRLGVIAAGALIAVGDAAGLTKLETAIGAARTDLRLAAVEAASAANNPIVVPTLKIGLLDRVITIRFTAAEGLAGFNAEKDAAVPVLRAALDSKDVSLVGRALAALARFGDQLQGLARSPLERSEAMINAPDPRQRLAAVPIVRTLPVADRVPLLRRLVGDPDVEVRRAGLDAIEDVAAKDKQPEQAVRLYRPLVRDPDPVVRAKASGQLSRWTPPPPPPGPAPAAAPPPPPNPDKDAKLEQELTHKLADATAAAADVTTANDAVDNAAGEVESLIGAAVADEAMLQQVKKLQTSLKQASQKLDAAADQVAAVAAAAGDTAGANPPTSAARQLIADVRRIADDARKRKTAAADRATALQTQADEFRAIQTPGVQILLARAKVEIDQADFRAAEPKLHEVARLLRRAGANNPRLDDLYAEVYRGMARNAVDPQDKRKQLRRAEAVYRRIEQTGTPARAQDATEQLKALAEELDQVGQGGPPASPDTAQPDPVASGPTQPAATTAARAAAARAALSSRAATKPRTA